MLVLHIGLGKAGSTTIQHAVWQGRDELLQRGLVIPPGCFKNRGNYVDLVAGMRGESDELANFTDLLRSHRDSTVFASSEFLVSARSQQIARLKAAIDKQPTKILVYVRSYVEWFPSLYGQAIRTGKFCQDFDRYYSQICNRRSVPRDLENWANEFDWKAIQIRALDKASLVGGDLIQDLSTVLGVKIPAIISRNVAPHWLDLEFMRALYLSEPKPGTLQSGPIFPLLRRTVRLFSKCRHPFPLPRVQYMNNAQKLAATNRYNDEMSVLMAHTGSAIPPLGVPDLTEREFVPSINCAPKKLRDKFLQRCFIPHSPAAHPYIQATLERMFEKEWIAG